MIYDNIKELCIKKGITICQLERMAGLANGTIRFWRTKTPRVKNLQAVADALGVKITVLLKEG